MKNVVLGAFVVNFKESETFHFEAKIVGQVHQRIFYAVKECKSISITVYAHQGENFELSLAVFSEPSNFGNVLHVPEIKAKAEFS